MVRISHFITWHVAVERQCYIHFTRRAPPLFPFAPHCQKKAPAWSGVCVCECININVYVCACVCDFAPHFLAIFWQYEVGIPFFCKTPPPSTFSFVTIYHCIFWYMSLVYFYLLYHVECDVAFSSDEILYHYDTLIQHKNEIYLNSITSVENAFLLFYAWYTSMVQRLLMHI